MYGKQYEDWLRTLKPGDEVAIDVSTYYGPQYEITTVEKVTPTGQIVTGKGRFNQQGRQRKDGWSHSWYVKPVTDKVRETVRRAQALRRVDRADWKKLSTDKLERIAVILDEEDKDNA